jgi:hypothetical protein
MQLSAMTHSTGKPLEWRKFSSKNLAAVRAMPIV